MLSKYFMNEVMTMDKEEEQEEISRVFIGMTEVARFHPKEDSMNGGENE